MAWWLCNEREMARNEVEELVVVLAHYRHDILSKGVYSSAKRSKRDKHRRRRKRETWLAV